MSFHRRMYGPVKNNNMSMALEQCVWQRSSEIWFVTSGCHNNGSTTRSVTISQSLKHKSYDSYREAISLEGLHLINYAGSFSGVVICFLSM